jgi:hypothetical protein
MSDELYKQLYKKTKNLSILIYKAHLLLPAELEINNKSPLTFVPEWE